MASPQPTDSHTRISNELYNQIILHDFTKRQRSILDLIIRLSYGCGKKTAYIQHLKNFEVCGVHRTSITAELGSLIELRVIGQNHSTHEFWMIKDYDQWLVSGRRANDESLSDLVRVNINWRNIKHGLQKVNMQVDETQIGEFAKHQSIIPETSSGTSVGGVPITKDNYLDKKTNDMRPAGQRNFQGQYNNRPKGRASNDDGIVDLESRFFSHKQG